MAVALPSLPLQDAGVETAATDGTLTDVLTETVVTAEHPSASVTVTVYIPEDKPVAVAVAAAEGFHE